jgi:Ion transport protein.
MAIIDLIAIAPFYLSFFFVMDLRFLRILRVMRIFKLTRYSESMTLLLQILRRESRSLASSFFILLVIMVIAASAIYLIEHDVQPEHFTSIPATMWWAIVTLTTVGYGDVYPVTIAGKLFASLIMIAGIGLVALPTAILASSFSSTLARSREKLTIELHKMLDDHEIDEQEQASLRKVT